MVARRGFRTDQIPSVSGVARNTTISAGDESEITVDDANLTRTTSSTVLYEYTLIPQYNRILQFDLDTIESSDESIATITNLPESGLVNRVSNGTTSVFITFKPTLGLGSVKKKLNLNPRIEESATVDQFVSWVDNSLAKHCTDNINTLIDGLDAETAKPIITVDGTFVRNTNCWVSGLDFTGFSPWNSREKYKAGGVLITPSDALMSFHYPLSSGHTMKFVTSDNTVLSRTVVSAENLLAENYQNHIRLVHFSEDLPSTIKPIKLVPSDLLDYLPGVQYGVPCISTDQEKKALINKLTALNSPDLITDLGSDYFKFSTSNVFSSDLYPYHESFILGDSGSPIFLPIDLGSGIEPVLVGVITFGPYGGGPCVVQNISRINSKLTQMGSEYQVSIANGRIAGLGDFTNYS